MKYIENRERHYIREHSYPQRVCNQINSLIPCTEGSESESRIMDILNRMEEHNPAPFEFRVYLHRDLYVKCNFDSDKAIRLFKYSGLSKVTVMMTQLNIPVWLSDCRNPIRKHKYINMK